MNIANGTTERRITGRAQSGAPSRLLLRWVDNFAHEKPVLDAGRGMRRNAIALAEQGLRIICADKDRERLGRIQNFGPDEVHRGCLIPVCTDVTTSRRPFMFAVSTHGTD